MNLKLEGTEDQTSDTETPLGQEAGSLLIFLRNASVELDQTSDRTTEQINWGKGDIISEFKSVGGASM